MHRTAWPSGHHTINRDAVTAARLCVSSFVSIFLPTLKPTPDDRIDSCAERPDVTGGSWNDDQFRPRAPLLLLPGKISGIQGDRDDVDGDVTFGCVFGQHSVGDMPLGHRCVKV